MTDKNDLFSYPEGYENAKSLIVGVPEEGKDMILYGLGRTII